jgi:electron-transferring-flavoprotein dehydrogenase
VPRLKGVHYAIESGRLAAEAAFAALRRGEVAGRRGALDRYDEALRESYVWKELAEVRNMRQVFDKGFFMGGALASAMTVTKGKLPPKDFETHRNAEAPLRRTGRAARYPAPDGSLTFDKLSSVFASATGHGTTSRATCASRRRCRGTSPRCGSGCAPPTSTR